MALCETCRDSPIPGMILFMRDGPREIYEPCPANCSGKAATDQRQIDAEQLSLSLGRLRAMAPEVHAIMDRRTRPSLGRRLFAACIEPFR